MKTIELKSTKGGKFQIEMPKGYKKIKLPFFKKWVAALESGKYRQSTQALCTLKRGKLTYCCLGVLSKVQGRLIKDDFYYYDINDDSSLVLADENPCASVFGVSGELPASVWVRLPEGRWTNKLTGCNDDLGLSFKDIAKIVKILYKA